MSLTTDDVSRMRQALELGLAVRGTTSPNPWVGAVLETADGRVFEGASAPAGGPHAEVVALRRAREASSAVAGATMWVTLEPCPHFGRTPPCTDELISARLARVVVGIEDPDARVAGEGLRRLRDAGIALDTGVLAAEVRSGLAPYLKHRQTGRPWVTLKLAMTLDGRTAAPDGSSRWITGAEARTDAHRLRAENDAVLVGAGTVRADDPELTVRHVAGRDPTRVVLGHVPPSARVRPALELAGPLTDVLDDLGQRGVLSLLVEGGATVAHELHVAGLVDRYVFYLAPALAGGDDAAPVFRGRGAPTMDTFWRGQIVDLRRLGDDLRVELAAAPG